MSPGWPQTLYASFNVMLTPCFLASTTILLNWIRKNGEKYGWYWGEATSENWHFTFCGDGVENTPGFCKKIVNKPIVNKDETKFSYPIVNDKDLEDEVFDPPIDMYPILKNLGRIKI